jgi:hypothetical protein
MKTTKRKSGGWTEFALIGDVRFGADLDPESAEFFLQVTNRTVERLDLKISEAIDGPDSSRWIALAGATRICFEYDDMVGTTIRIHGPDLQHEEKIVCALEDVLDAL